MGEIDILAHGLRIYLKGFGFAEARRVAALNGDKEHWATRDLTMMKITRIDRALSMLAIENYHRQLKQCCGIEQP